MLCGNKGRRKETNQEAVLTVQSENGCTLDEDSNSGDGKKWSNSKCILKSEPTGFADKSHVEYRREESWVTSRFLI